MATREQLENALRNAHKAGDKEAARRLAQALAAREYNDADAAPPQPDTEQKAPGQTLQQRVFGSVLEPLMTVGSSIVAEPAAGIAGAYGAITDGAAQGTRNIEATREALTYMPRTQQGQGVLRSVGEAVKPVTDALESGSRYLGDVGYDVAGPTGGAIGYTLPAAITEVLGYGVGRKLKNAGNAVERFQDATPDARSQRVISAGEDLDVPVMTTDVLPPETYMGRLLQSISEKLGPLGSGSARASQQRAREAAVRALADEFEIELDSPFANQIVRSLNSKAAKDLERAGAVRTRALAALDPYGDLPMNRTVKAIQAEIARQKALGRRGDKALIKSFEDTLAELSGRNFSSMRDLRTNVIDSKKAAARGENTKPADYWQNIKSAMDKDMMAFARANDRGAAADWIRSNRAFAEAYTTQRDTELKRILDLGEATPETVIPILRRGRTSELQRMYNSLTPKGREAARRAILQDALKDSKFFDVGEDPNPNAFATALNRPNRQKALNVFFEGRQREQLDGLNRLLNATRRAQEGQAMIKTGEQNLMVVLSGLLGFGAGAVGGPQGIAAITAVSGLAKAYESKAVRNALLRLANTKPGTPAETKALELAVAAVAGALPAAIEEQQETEPKP